MPLNKTVYGTTVFKSQLNIPSYFIIVQKMNASKDLYIFKIHVELCILKDSSCFAFCLFGLFELKRSIYKLSAARHCFLGLIKTREIEKMAICFAVVML